MGRKKAEAPKCGEADAGRRAKEERSCLNHNRSGAKYPATLTFVALTVPPTYSFIRVPLPATPCQDSRRCVRSLHVELESKRHCCHMCHARHLMTLPWDLG